MKNSSTENNHYYNKNLQGFARKNKKRMTKGEACMWKYLLSKGQMKGFKFRRQRPILNYIVDFACLELMLVIEVDGISHEFGDPEKDITRDKNLNEIGFHVLRFSDWKILNEMSEVRFIIEKWISEHHDNSNSSNENKR